MKKTYIFLIISLISLSAISQTDSIDALHYEVNLDINNLIKGRHKGYAKVRAKVVNPINNIVSLSLLNHQIDSVYINNTPAIYTYTNSEHINISLPLGTQNDDEVEICVWYSGGQVIELYGWGGIHYNSNIIYTLNVALLENQHSFARSWFPARDYYNDKASFNLNITTNKSRKAICGGILDSISSISDSSSSWHWRIPQNIPPYLIGMSIADYILIEDTIAAMERVVPLNIYAFASDTTILKSKIGMIKDAFHNLENKFGAFRFNRVGYSVTPMGSMEHVDNISLAHSAAIGQGDANNSNIIHELGHTWFGNYMGGESELDMWIKEGWTSWTESLSFEAHYGIEHAKDYFRNNLEMIIDVLPKREGYRILYGVKGKDVYSTTTYRKGAAVVHTLRGYLGDDIFFPAVRSMINNYAYGSLNTFELRDYLSSATNIDLNDFFNFYVLDSGYNHYSIAKKVFNENSATIAIKQRIVGGRIDGGCNLSRIPVTFIDKDWNKEKRLIIFNGMNSTQTIDLNIKPVNCFIDMEEEIADATTDNYKVIDTLGFYTFSNTYFNAIIKSNPDSILLRVTHNWLGEEKTKPLPEGVSRISRKHYWSIEGMNLEKCEIEGKFYYRYLTGEHDFDRELISSYESFDSLMLLYRPNHFSEWIAVNTTSIDVTTGYLTLNSLWEGDYIMAIGDKGIIGNKNIEAYINKSAKIYPSIVKDKFILETNNINSDCLLSIIDSKGKIVYKSTLKAGINKKEIKINLSQGFYLITLISKDQELILRDKIIIIK